MLIATGTEDYYNSGWYFSAGQFHMPTTGFTHLNTTNGVTWSGERTFNTVRTCVGPSVYNNSMYDV